MNRIQKLTIWDFFFPALLAFTGIGTLTFLLFALFSAKQHIYVIIFEFMLLIAFGISVIAFYVNCKYINRSIGKSIHRISRGHFEYSDQNIKVNLTEESIARIKLYIPGSSLSALAITFVKIQLNSGEKVFFNSLVCEPDFFKYELKNVTMHTEKWRLKDLKALLSKK
jgi:hypothetical protein